MIVRALIIMMLWLSVYPASAVTVHRKVNADGSVEFSDEPFAGSEPVKIETEPVNKVNQEVTKQRLLRQQREFDKNKPAEKPSGIVYKSIKITSPQTDQIIRSNGGEINVAVSISPPLVNGDEVVFYINGAVAGRSSSASTRLSGLANGLQNLSAAVVSGGKESIKSQSVEFHVLRKVAGQSSTSGDSDSDGDAAATVAVGNFNPARPQRFQGQRNQRFQAGRPERFQPGSTQRYTPDRTQRFVPGRVNRSSGN